MFKCPTYCQTSAPAFHMEQMQGIATTRNTKDTSKGVIAPPYQTLSEACVRGAAEAANCASKPAPIAAKYCTSQTFIQRQLNPIYHRSKATEYSAKNISPNMYRNKSSENPHRRCSPTIQHSNVLKRRDVAAPPRRRPTISTEYVFTCFVTQAAAYSTQ